MQPIGFDTVLLTLVLRAALRLIDLVTLTPRWLLTTERQSMRVSAESGSGETTSCPSAGIDSGEAAGQRKHQILVSGLKKSFRQPGGWLKAVDEVNFSVQGGQVFGLLGPNGAGKTTTLRMILGLITPDAGFAEINGMRSDAHPDFVKQSIGFVSANTGLYQWLTAREALLFFAGIYGVSAEMAEVRLQELAEQLAMGSFLDRRCGLLSTGQSQRVNLAKALIHDPPIMLLDEPTLGLDVLGSQVVFDYLHLLKQRQCAVILSTHRLEQAQRVCDEFGLMDRGKIRMRGHWESIQQQSGRSSLVDVFIAWSQVADRAELANGNRKEQSHE